MVTQNRKHTRFDARLDCKESEQPLPPSAQLVSHFSIPHFTAFSKSKRTFFFLRHYLKSIFRHWKVFYFLITLFRRIFNHPLPAVYCTVLYEVCVGEGGYGGEEERSVTVMWAVSKSQENKKTPSLHAVVPLYRTKWPLSPCLPNRHNWVFRGKFLWT